VAADYTAFEQVIDELVPPVQLKIFEDALDTDIAAPLTSKEVAHELKRLASDLALVIDLHCFARSQPGHILKGPRPPPRGAHTIQSYGLQYSFGERFGGVIEMLQPFRAAPDAL
jgi:hypothetical protein